jgi:hypothetical protein
MLDVVKRTAGWTTVAFGDVVQLYKERSGDPEADGYERYIGLEHIDPGDLRIRRWGNVADGVTFTSVFRPGQVLFGKRRAYQRKVAVADFSGVCSGDIYVLEPKGIERLGFAVRDGRKQGHKVVLHDGIPNFWSAAFTCGHGRNPEVKAAYVTKIRKALLRYEVEIINYLESSDEC